MEKKSKSHIDISLKTLKRFNRALSFDVYVQRTEQSYTKIFKKGDMIEWERVKLYENKGITHFYLTAEDYQTYGSLIGPLGEYLVENSGKFSPKEARELLKDLAQFTVHEMIGELKADERFFYNAQNVVAGCIDIMAKDSKGILSILKMLSNRPYALKHSMMVSVLSVILAKADGMVSDTNLKIIGLGGFLHDAGIAQLSFDPESSDQLGPEQRREMNRHPELGRQFLDRLKGIRSEVLEIVMQHHEQPNGAGYPNSLRAGEIYYPAKMVAIADSFSSLITKRSFRDAFLAEEAISIMKGSIGKFDKVLLSLFSETILKQKKT